MRIRSIVIVAAIGALSISGSARAQSAVAGPLAAPGTAEPPSAKPAKPKHRKPVKTAHHVDPTPATPTYGESPAPTASHPVARAASPTDPVDFGMKWSGSSDSARETRVQNYNGDVEGTGAQVGMKLHF